MKYDVVVIGFSLDQHPVVFRFLNCKVVIPF